MLGHTTPMQVLQIVCVNLVRGRTWNDTAAMGVEEIHGLLERHPDSATQGELNYDHRERGTLIENDRFAALNAPRELREGLTVLT